MTSREATAGVGQRVTDTESGWVGTLRAVERVEPTGGSAYFVGLVEFGGSARRVWLQRLTWADGLETPATLPAPYAEVMRALAACGGPGRAGPLRRLFRLLFGRGPTASEVQYLTGRLGGETCGACGSARAVVLAPSGEVGLVCGCPASDCPDVEPGATADGGA